MSRANTRPRISRDFGKLAIETPFHQDFVDAIKTIIPRTYRSYDKGMWFVDPSYYGAVIALLEAFWGSTFIDSVGGVAEPQSSSWKEPWDVWRNSKDKQFQRERKSADSGWDIIGSKPSPSAYATLYVTQDAPRQVIEAAFRVLAKLHHPDSGGDTETMSRINQAFQELKKKGRV